MGLGLKVGKVAVGRLEGVDELGCLIGRRSIASKIYIKIRDDAFCFPGMPLLIPDSVQWWAVRGETLPPLLICPHYRLSLLKSSTPAIAAKISTI